MGARKPLAFSGLRHGIGFRKGSYMGQHNTPSSAPQGIRWAPNTGRSGLSLWAPAKESAAGPWAIRSCRLCYLTLSITRLVMDPSWVRAKTIRFTPN